MRAANLPSLRGLITSGYHLRIATAKAISEAEVYFRRGSSGETAQTAALKAFFEAAIDAIEAAEAYSQVVLPKNTVAPAITGTAKVGKTLTVTTGTWTGTSPTYTIEWLRDGVVIEGETDTTYVLVADDEGAVISVRVTATNARGSVSALSNETDPVEPIVLPENTVAPALSGTAKVGETLTVTTGTWTGDDLVYTIEWLRDGAVIEGESETTYVLVADDEGAVISVRVTATNAGGSASALSNETDPVEPEEPVE